MTTAYDVAATVTDPEMPMLTLEDLGVLRHPPLGEQVADPSDHGLVVAHLGQHLTGQLRMHPGELGSPALVAGASRRVPVARDAPAAGSNRRSWYR